MLMPRACMTEELPDKHTHTLTQSLVSNQGHFYLESQRGSVYICLKGWTTTHGWHIKANRSAHAALTHRLKWIYRNESKRKSFFYENVIRVMMNYDKPHAFFSSHCFILFVFFFVKAKPLVELNPMIRQETFSNRETLQLTAFTASSASSSEFYLSASVTNSLVSHLWMSNTERDCCESCNSMWKSSKLQEKRRYHGAWKCFL